MKKTSLHRIRVLTAGILLLAGFGLALAATQTDIVGPPGSGQFGSQVAVLPNGNFVVADPGYDITSPSVISNVGAVYLYDGATGTLISTLTGSAANDQVGVNNAFELAVMVLPSGDFLVRSFFWDNDGVVNAGAVTFCDGATGCNGVVSPSNSLVGSQASDFVGASAVTVLANGDYVVGSSQWNNAAVADAGARTWCSGSTGCSGAVSPANSLVGSTASDLIGNFGVFSLADGDYLVVSPSWDGAATDTGAVTFCSGSTGCTGPVSAANSLVGSLSGDRVGSERYVELSNGNYVVLSGGWDKVGIANVGAVTWCSGDTGCTGAVSAANSVVGTTVGQEVGLSFVTALSNGNYVVPSPKWDSVQSNVGAVRLCSGAGGCVGELTAGNSLIGRQANDGVGNVAALTNGHYVVLTPAWNSDTQTDVGAATWCDGTSGCIGLVEPANSLVGPNQNSTVGSAGALALSNGNYVVRSPSWNGGAGAATFCVGTAPCTGTVSDVNSLAGGFGHQVGNLGIFGLPNGHYVVVSPRWDDGATLDVGAVTWCSGATGCMGAVTAANSLVGSQTTDLVGGNQSNLNIVLTDGDYVIHSPFWNNGGTADVGAVTHCSGNGGCVGPVTPGNSVVGSSTNERLQTAIALSNGNYVVASPFWDGVFNDVGAVRWCNGATSCTGTLTDANSLVGSTASDSIGQVTALPNGDYVVGSQQWDNKGIVNAGAVTYGVGDGSTVGPITAENSVRGMVNNSSLPFTSRFAFDPVNQQLVVGRALENIVSLFRLQAVLQITGAVSRKMHGAAGTFDINLPLTGAPGVECRSSGGNHTLVVEFTNDVVSGNANVTTGVGLAGAPTFAGNTLTVDLTGVADVQQVVVTLSSVTDSFGQVLPNTQVTMNLLIGDTNGNKTVNTSDIGQTKSQSGAPVIAANFRQDVTPNGTINTSDIGLVKSRSGASLP